MPNTSSGSLGGGSFVSKSGQSAFDVQKETDLLNLLKLIHTQPIDPHIKNHLRDLIFAYRQSFSKDDALKIKQSLEPFGINILFDATAQDTLKKSVPQEVKPSLGSSRPLPRFDTLLQNVEAAETVAKVPVAEEKKEIKNEPLTEVPTTQVPASTAGAEVPLQGDGAPANASARINEIKRLVNAKVGNPVNLIDSHNEIGREYMNALLDAMKKSNGAQQGELAIAMARLETAFKQVQDTVLNTQEKEVETPASSVPPMQAATAPSTEDTSAVEEATPVTSVAREERTEIRAPLSMSGDIRPLASAQPRSESLSSLKENLVHEQVGQPPQPEENRLDDATQKVPIQRIQKPVEAVPDVRTSTPLHSVAKEKQLQDLLRVDRMKEVQSKKEQIQTQQSQTDPLQTPEVTAGLDQLLSEWGLFKSSGIFGTGPNGNDHPLYKKIAGLTMAAVIAGRFEGATPAIKQSIADYMNGWRYEEGIVHEHAETFEHYLRKVVRHILSRKMVK